MNDFIENNRAQWRRLIGLHRAIAANRSFHQPMLDLIRWLANSEFADWLAPDSSHFLLVLAATGVYPIGSKTTAHVSNCDDQFSIEYRQHQSDGGYSILQRSYAHDEIRPAIESWLWRLQMEAEIRRQSGET